MKTNNITTTLNIKITAIVVFLILTTTAYNHWLSLQKESQENIRYLITVTEFLVKKTPPNFFSEIALQQDVNNTPPQERVLAINKELQPLLDNICLPISTIKFGLYSRHDNSIVAIGPQYDKSLLRSLDAERIDNIYNDNTEKLFEKKNSLVWYGAKVITYTKPIVEHGLIVGHAFATINQDAVSSVIWQRTINTFLGAVLMLLVCFIIFRELFVQLKKDMQLFAESILAGHAYNFSSGIPEFTPLLQYISEQTEKMTRLDRLNIIGEMAAGIAHEIRNPMTTVRGLLQFIGKKQEFSSQKENFSLMINELDRANTIITEFLSLAKNRAMELGEYNLDTIVQDLYPLLQADALCNNSNIIIHLGTTSNISADQSSIRQLILNMVRNGLDAMPTGGVVHISTANKDSKVLLLITDSGSGIPLEIRDKLGVPFFTTKDHGTGLGLAICYRILERHGATLTIESQSGEGTTFIIEFNAL